MVRACIVCGGRLFQDRELMHDALSDLLMRQHGHLDTIVHGGASGADYLAGEWGKRNGYQVIVFEANWKQHGKAAGPIRNSLMLELAKPELVVAFPGGRGTADMIRKAEEVDVLTIEVGYDYAGG